MPTQFERFRNSSKTFIGFMFPVFILYTLALVFIFLKTQGGKNVILLGSYNVQKLVDFKFKQQLEVFKRVVETDMLYSYFVYFLAVAMGTMFEILVIFSILMIACTFLLTFAHLRNNDKLRKIGKLVNVVLTIIGFINIMADDMTHKND